MLYKQDYFGYVYEWTNIHTGRKYIGSHYGSVEDYYKGSGVHFLPEYNKNPEIFDLNILEFIKVNDKKETLIAEQTWLDKVLNIKNNNLYYNASNDAGGGWSHITKKEIDKRAETLKEKHLKHGYSDAEKEGFISRIQNKINRMNECRFTKKEKEQFDDYSCEVKVILPDNSIKIYKSYTDATKDLQINVRYGVEVCLKRERFKGYRFIKMKDPKIDCRAFKNKRIYV